MTGLLLEMHTEQTLSYIPHSHSLTTMQKRSVTPINQNWTFKQADKKNSKWLSVSQFPTSVHLDLIANGLISDPFIGKNELDCQWVGEAVWVYRTTFESPNLSVDGR